jgi:hypothetical protein
VIAALERMGVLLAEIVSFGAAWGAICWVILRVGYGKHRDTF